MKRTTFDVIIVGAGPGGIFATLEIMKRNPNASILLIEKGKPIENRVCPEKTTGKCMHCPVCGIMSGFAGAGAFSDGKVHYYTKEMTDIAVGGNLHKYVGVDKTIELSKDVHDIFTSFGVTAEVSGLENKFEINEIRKKIEAVEGLKLPIVPVRHMGTDKSRVAFAKIEDFIANSPKVTVMYETEITGLVVENNTISAVLTSSKTHTENDDIFYSYSSNVVLALGRSGSQFTKTLFDRYNVSYAPGTIDIGVRVECPRSVWEELCKNLYELKILVKTPTYKDSVRTFCMNDGGEVTSERTNEIVCVNGHANKDTKTCNTNYAILVSINFSDIDAPMDYMEKIGKLLNQLGHGNVLVQRLGDIRAGKRTWKEELDNNSVVPSLKSAEAGDITFGFPGRVITDIVEAIDMIGEAVPGSADDDVLLYGSEMKFYGIRPIYSDSSRLETSVKGLFAIGDGCGLTHGIVQAAESGVLVGRVIAEYLLKSKG